MGLFDRFKKKEKTIPEQRENLTPKLPELLHTSNELHEKGNGTDDREALLNQFLSHLSPKPFESFENTGDIQDMAPDSYSLDAYPEIAASPALEKKILELKAITQTIDNKTLHPEKLNLPDLSKFRINYAAALNPAQLAGVITTEQPVLCIAGAGSGKTRVIVHRVSYLIEKGVDPQSILLLTFTRKAANEMLERVESLLHNKNVAKVTGGTFHSFASFVLRRYANLLNLPVNFTIIDTADSEDIIDLIRTELKFNTKDRKFPKKSRIYDIISYSRNKQTSIETIIRKQYTGLEDYTGDINLIYSGYSRYKKASHILDFDDLLEVLNESLKNNLRFREIIQHTYNYVMVDEFQDTNAVQNEIVKNIAEKHHRIMVVGDDSQSIYAFRGADYENILRFPQTYPDAVVIRIEENYRSNHNILDFTNQIIEHARTGFRKKLFTRSKNEHFPVIQRTYGQDDEAVFIVDRIMELIEQGIPLNQIAVLNRADWHNRYIEAELNKRGIPYVVVGGFKFNERLHIKDIIAYLRLTLNPYDAVSWHRVLKYLGGIGRITAGNIITAIHDAENPFSFEAFKQRKFYADMMKLGAMLAKASMPELTLPQKFEIIREYYAPLLKAREDDYAGRMQDIDVLIDLSKKYRSPDRFLSDFALDPPSRRVADQTTPLIDEGEEKGKITVSTIHSAKGLEWYAVFIPHALEGMIPSNRAVDIEEMEEERRLFYVACSRAKEELYITFPRMVYSFDAYFNLPSRFLVELDKNIYQWNG